MIAAALAILVIGDSISAGCCGDPSYPELLSEHYDVQVEAVLGAPTSYWHPEGDAFSGLSYLADVALIFLGVNDARIGVSAAYYTEGVLRIVDALIVPRVCVVSVPAFPGYRPAYPHYGPLVAEYQDEFEQMDVACKVDLSGMGPEHYDSLTDPHPNTLGHAYIAERIVAAVPEPSEDLLAGAAGLMLVAIALGRKWR